MGLQNLGLSKRHLSHKKGKLNRAARIAARMPQEHHGCALQQRTNDCVVELVRFTLESFELANNGIAAWLGLEIASIVADELLLVQEDK